MKTFTKAALRLGAAVTLTSGLAACASVNNMMHGRNPCAPAAAANPCAAKNPCKAKNPCAAANPCAAKNPCAPKNPCAAAPH